MCAATVVAPACATSAGADSVASRSRSVLFSASRPSFASISTLERIGIVLRRSTMRWTWPRALSRAVRSIVTFIAVFRSQNALCAVPRLCRFAGRGPCQGDRGCARARSRIPQKFRLKLPAPRSRSRRLNWPLNRRLYLVTRRVESAPGFPGQSPRSGTQCSAGAASKRRDGSSRASRTLRAGAGTRTSCAPIPRIAPRRARRPSKKSGVRAPRGEAAALDDRPPVLLGLRARRLGPDRHCRPGRLLRQPVAADRPARDPQAPAQYRDSRRWTARCSPIAATPAARRCI